jgi:hypothetical protein
MHPIQDLFFESFSYELQFDMHFYMLSYLHKSFYSCKKWVLHIASAELQDLKQAWAESPPDPVLPKAKTSI